MSKNMELWDKVCRTDPTHAKRVNQRGGFTAIDAMYQIESATKVFGAVGQGWGWHFSEPLLPGNGTVVIKCTLWHGKREQTVEHFGQKSLGSKDRADEDAFKKAATDGLTKCLSYLGFNADVFLGKFDDSKYVESIAAEKQAEDSRKKAEGFVNQYLIELEACPQDDLEDLTIKHSAGLKRIHAGYPDLSTMINNATAKKRAAL